MARPVRRAKRRRERPLLERILETPHLAHVVPHLEPQILHKVIERCGLEDCGALVALATPEQLMGVFDLDLWRGAPGFDEHLDADRFGAWLEVLMDQGPAVAIGKLIGVDVDLVIAALAQHLAVFDGAAVAAFLTTDGDESVPCHTAAGDLDCEIGGFLVEARRPQFWDAIVGLLRYAADEHPGFFGRVMCGCRDLSSSLPEVDGLHDLMTARDQDVFDVASARENRRDRQGYVTPAQALAFLRMARELSLAADAPPARNPIAGAYFCAIDWNAPIDADAMEPSRDAASAPASATEPVDPRDGLALVVELLRDEGVLSQQPRAFLASGGEQEPRLARLHEHLQQAAARGDAAISAATQELAYLANALMAGCAIQGRALTASEASDAAAATCHLGLENWPAHWPGQTSSPDLVSAFQVGWNILYRGVCMHATGRLIAILDDLRCGDDDIGGRLAALRAALARGQRDGEPWRAREALDVIMMLDMPTWAGLLGLIDECPVIHAAITASGSGARSVGASSFEFIADNHHMTLVHAFLDALPATLAS